MKFISFKTELNKIIEEAYDTVLSYNYIPDVVIESRLLALFRKYYGESDSEDTRRYMELLYNNIVVNCEALLEVNEFIPPQEKESLKDKALAIGLYGALMELAVENERIAEKLLTMNGNTDFRDLNQNREDVEEGMNSSDEYNQALLEYPNSIVTWIWNPNERTRHEGMAGEARRIGDLFTIYNDKTDDVDFGRYPREAGISASNSSNCRCDFTINKMK